jgi:hypothetical protein
MVALITRVRVLRPKSGVLSTRCEDLRSGAPDGFCLEALQVSFAQVCRLGVPPTWPGDREPDGLRTAMPANSVRESVRLSGKKARAADLAGLSE